jgi:hypothetical protein
MDKMDIQRRKRADGEIPILSAPAISLLSAFLDEVSFFEFNFNQR